MPTFKSEKHRQSWIASVRATKDRKRQEKAEEEGRQAKTEGDGRPHHATLPCVMAPVRAPADSAPVSLGIISEALTQLEEDAATLRRAIEIIERVQG